MTDEEKKINDEIYIQAMEIMARSEIEAEKLRMNYVISLVVEMGIFFLLMALNPFDGVKEIIYKLGLLVFHSLFVYILYKINKRKTKKILDRSKKVLDVIIKATE